jgi:hypothetical protein
MLGLVAIIGLAAWPKLDAATSKTLEVQAECGLLNADCGGGPSSGSAQATAAPGRRVGGVGGSDPAVLRGLVSLANSLQQAEADTKRQSMDLAELRARMQRGAPAD